MKAAAGLEVLGLSKAYDGIQAVDEVTLRARPGTILGLLGPNGAGKTTTIRVIMGILGADTGAILYRGENLTPDARRKFGYLPEERGLYQKPKLLETLVYLAELKGLSRSAATTAVGEQLERMGLMDRARQPVSALSKGNQQKAQFIAAVVSDPEVIILDEPFSGLDPINQQVLKEIISEKREQGKVILLSSHQLEQVERLCDDICLINAGQVVLEGSLAEIKRRYSTKLVEVTFQDAVPAGADRWLRVSGQKDNKVTGHLKGSRAESLAGLVALGQVEEFKLREPSLEDIFVEVVKGDGE
ncbi:MAG: ATP-binding cassette domain-containing protein [Candidatus Marinimicrobia bacterium]|nr:ATP-binding cassette domain-containing protein [Candidatus Neomarinimicrobiota bacterium]